LGCQPIACNARQSISRRNLSLCSPTLIRRAAREVAARVIAVLLVDVDVVVAG
jgi:hypothetical protein